MKKTVVSAGFALGMMLLLSNASAEQRAYPCYRLAQEPLLDGVVAGDPAWENIPGATGFFALRSNYLTAVKRTSFKMGRSLDAIYIGIRCDDPDVDKIRSIARDNDVAIWQEDSVEIFLFPTGAKNYYQFMVSAAGARWNGIGEPGGSKVTLGVWQAKTSRGKTYWSVEIKIPFNVFDKVPAENESWTGNICRNILTSGSMQGDAYGDRFASWTNQVSGFHEKERFGSIIFHDRLLSPTETAKIETEDRLQAARIAKAEITERVEQVKTEINRILEGVPVQAKDLAETGQSPEGKKETLAIVAAAAKIRNKVSSSQKMTIAELDSLKKTMEESRDLLSRADAMKREMLIKELFK